MKLFFSLVFFFSFNLLQSGFELLAGLTFILCDLIMGLNGYILGTKQYFFVLQSLYFTTRMYNRCISDVCKCGEFILLFIIWRNCHVTHCCMMSACFFAGSSDILFLCGRITGQYPCSHAVVSLCFVLVQVSADSVSTFRACSQCRCSLSAVRAKKIDHTFVLCIR